MISVSSVLLIIKMSALLADLPKLLIIISRAICVRAVVRLGTMEMMCLTNVSFVKLLAQVVNKLKINVLHVFLINFKINFLEMNAERFVPKTRQ